MPRALTWRRHLCCAISADDDLLLSLWDPAHALHLPPLPPPPCAPAGYGGDAGVGAAHAAIAAAAHAALTRSAWALPYAPPAMAAMPPPLPEASAVDVFELMLPRHAPVC